MKKLFLILVCLVVTSCLPENQVSKPIQIKEYVIGAQKLYIPDVYTNFKHTSVGGKSGFIQMWYPGDAPVPGDPGDLWRQGEWEKNIMLLFNYAPKAIPEKSLQGTLEHHAADTFIDNEYGLEHYSQSDDYFKKFKDDVWVVDRPAGSRISCTKKQTPDDPVQLCKHYMFVGKISFKITYNKKLLPEWKTIQSSVLSLYESFSSPEAAQAYITQFYQEGE